MKLATKSPRRKIVWPLLMLTSIQIIRLQENEKPPLGTPTERNHADLVEVQGGKECPYYMFHHPDPTNMASRDPMLEHESEDIPQQNVQASSQLNVPVWSADQRALNEHCPPVLAPAPSYSAGMAPPWGVYPSPEWSRYHQVPLGPYYPAGISFHHFPAPPLKYRGADVPGPEYPERPGQPECQHFVKTGFCKFRAKCIFHHPRSAGPLSPLGLPLRHDQPVCTYYDRYGVCKFGPACMYNHPFNFGHPVWAAWQPLSANTSLQETTRSSEQGR